MTGNVPAAADLRKGLRFAVVGAITALIYFVLLSGLMRYGAMDYRWAVTIAYVAAVSFHFVANRRYTFRAHDAPAARQAVRYLALLALNYVVMVAVATGLVELFGFAPLIGAGAAVAVTTVVAFALAHSWVFRVG